MRMAFTLVSAFCCGRDRRDETIENMVECLMDILALMNEACNIPHNEAAGGK